VCSVVASWRYMVGLVALCVVWIRPLIHKNTGILHCVQDDDENNHTTS
jgi:hypothetical protein